MGPGRRGRRTPVESIVMGLAMGGALVAWWAVAPGSRDSWWLLPAAIVMGIMPVARGISGIVAQRSEIAREREARRLAAGGGGERVKGRGGAAQAERTILRLASERGGKLTPSLVVLGSDMTIEEAERALDGLAKKGHAALRVRDDGRVEYEFSEFLPRAGVAN